MFSNKVHDISLAAWLTAFFVGIAVANIIPLLFYFAVTQPWFLIPLLSIPTLSWYTFEHFETKFNGPVDAENVKSGWITDIITQATFYLSIFAWLTKEPLIILLLILASLTIAFRFALIYQKFPTEKPI